jgi:hypothetical protein
MADPQIQPHLITKPIQMLAVWMSGLVVLDGSFLTAARFLTEPAWLPPLLAISAVALVPLFLIALFLLQTKFRPQLQEDSYYSEYLERQTKVFRNFKAENLRTGQANASGAETKIGLEFVKIAGDIVAGPKFDAEGLEAVRVRRYEKYQGVFLVHSWRPSREPGQVADIVLRLQQHGDGPLRSGLVEAVEYALGPKFFAYPQVKTNRDESFRLEVSAYGPLLCIARVCLKDGSTFDLERYLDFAPAVHGGLKLQDALLASEPISGRSRDRAQ